MFSFFVAADGTHGRSYTLRLTAADIIFVPPTIPCRKHRGKQKMKCFSSERCEIEMFTGL